MTGRSRNWLEEKRTFLKTRLRDVVGERSSKLFAGGMAAKLILAPEAELDITEAYVWYEQQRSGLGERNSWVRSMRAWKAFAVGPKCTLSFMTNIGAP